jgi:hypothetical protein
VRCHNDYPAAGREQPVKLFHRANHVGYVFDHMDGAYFRECAVAEREGKMIQVGNYIRTRVCVPIYSDCTRILVNPTADIED